MEIKGSPKIMSIVCSKFAKYFGIDIEEAQTLKSGNSVDLEEEVAEKIIEAGYALKDIGEVISEDLNEFES